MTHGRAFHVWDDERKQFIKNIFIFMWSWSVVIVGVKDAGFYDYNYKE